MIGSLPQPVFFLMAFDAGIAAGKHGCRCGCVVRSPVQQEIDQNIQLTLYSWVFRMLYGQQEKAIKVVSLVKTKEPKVIITDTWRVAREHSWLIATFAQVIRGIEMKLFYPNPIGGFGCFNCQYQEKCKEASNV